MVAVSVAPASAATTWTAPSKVIEPAGSANIANYPEISDNGSRIAWQEGPNGRHPFVADRSGETAWGSPTELMEYTPGTRDSADPMRFSGNGKGAAFSFGDYGGSGTPGFGGNKDRTSGGWQAPGAITEFFVGDYTGGPAISRDAGQVAWQKGWHAWTASWGANGEAGTPVDLGDGWDPQISADGKHIAYIGYGDDNYAVWLASFNGSTWVKTKIFEDAEENVEEMLGISADGSNILFAYDYYNVPIQGIKKVGNSWQHQVVVPTDSVYISDGGYYSVATDGSFAYRDRDRDNQGMLVQFRNGSWQTPMEITGDETTSVSISDDAKSFAWTVGGAVKAKVYDGGWDVENTIDQTEVNSNFVNVSGDGQSVTYKSGSSSVWYSRITEPGAPSNVVASKASSTSAKVTWTAAPAGIDPITSYKVQAYEGSTPVSGKTCTVAASGTTCTVTGLTTGKTYKFKVRAVTSGGDGPDSDFSNSVTLTGGSSSVKKPAKPTKVTVGPSSPFAKKYAVRWKAPVDKTGTRPVQWYRLKLNLNGCGSFIINKKLNKKVTSFTITRKQLLKNNKCKLAGRGEVKAKAYRFRVRVEAFNSAGGGPVATRFIRIIVKG